MTDRMITRGEVERLCSLSRSSVYRLMALGDFPRPRRVGVRGVRWPESEVTAWLQSRPVADGERAA